MKYLLFIVYIYLIFHFSFAVFSYYHMKLGYKPSFIHNTVFVLYMYLFSVCRCMLVLIICLIDLFHIYQWSRTIFIVAGFIFSNYPAALYFVICACPTLFCDLCMSHRHCGSCHHHVKCKLILVTPYDECCVVAGIIFSNKSAVFSRFPFLSRTLDWWDLFYCRKMPHSYT